LPSVILRSRRNAPTGMMQGGCITTAGRGRRDMISVSKNLRLVKAAQALFYRTWALARESHAV
jgi:hypothetical protein